MKKYIFEFRNFDPPSNNWVKTANRFVYDRYKESLKTLLAAAANEAGYPAEGPWPKYLVRKEYPKNVRQEIQRILREKWAKKTKVFAETLVRRPRRFDKDNHNGGFKPLWDVFCRMGWMVDDHVKWFDYKHHQQQIGESYTTVTLLIPETKQELEECERAFNV